MKGGKDEEKHLDPLYPRIHINDAEKVGGPRAPPRNKMALCEQLTLPCNRFTSGSLSMLPLPPSTTTTTSLAWSASLSNHVSCHKKSMFSPFCSSPGSSDVTPHPHVSVGVNFNTALTNPKPRPVAPTSYTTSSATHHLPVTTENKPFQQYSFLSTTNFMSEKIREQDRLRLPTFAHLPGSIPHADSWESIENYKLALSCSNSPGKLQITCEKQQKESSISLNPKEFVGKQAGGNCKLSPQSGEHHGKMLDPVLSTKEKIVIDANSLPLARDNNAEADAGANVINCMRRQAECISKVSQTSDSMKRPASVFSTKERIFKAASGSLPQDRNAEEDAYTVVSVSQKRSSLLEHTSKPRDPYAQSHQDYKNLQENNATRDGTSGNLETFSRKRSGSTIESQLCSIQRLGEEHRSPSTPATVNECSKDQDCVSLQVGIIDRSDGTSDTSMVEESIAGSAIFPDDVVEVIGQKHFWKARRTIVDQQRIFAAQIFELHRLIKVQRLMAESPEMLFERNFYLGKPSIKFSPMKNLIAENIRDPSPLSVQAKADSRKPNLSVEGTAEKTYGKPSPVDNDTQKGANSQHSTPNKPLLFHPPPGNQWLIPVRSPSEGLIYKPYTGPCPPSAGFLTPVFGSPAPISLPGGAAGNLLNTAFCLPAPNQQGMGNYPNHTAISQSFIQPYHMPVTNASASSSTVERMSAFSKPQPVKQDMISIPTTNPLTPFQNSCNIPSQKSWIISDYGGKLLQVSKERSDLQGSTASSPPERNGDALNLFPTTPSIHVSDQPARSCSPEQQIQVIKVVPHSRKSASESAARIFQAIQEERKQLD